MRAWSGSVRIGMAVGADALIAVIDAGGAARTESVPLPPGDAGSLAPALGPAFAALSERIDPGGTAPRRVRLDVVLLPPLSEARLVALPPLRQGEAEAVLRRDAARHFIGGSQPRAVGVRLAGRARGNAAAPPALAVAAAIPLLEAVHAAAAAAGWQVHAIGAAHAAWLAALDDAAAGGSDETDTERVVIAVLDGTAHVIRSTAGAVTALRRLPAASPADVAAACGAGPGTALLLAEGTLRRAVAGQLQAAGWNVPDAVDADAAVTAGRHAGGARPALMPPSAHAARAQRARRLSLRMAAAAAALLVAAAGVELWGAAHELDALREQRAAIRAEVGPLLAARDSLDRLHARVAVIDGLTGGSPRWTRALFDIALLLPAETHMTRFVASGDTVEIDASGARAGAALQALRDAGTLRDVRLLGTVDRELSAGATAVERFRIGARYAPPAVADRSARSPGSTP